MNNRDFRIGIMMAVVVISILLVMISVYAMDFLR
jgi:hypothetical protein